MSEHTPTPWKIYGGGMPATDWPGINTSDRTIVIWGNSSDDLDEAGVRGKTVGEAIENARFIVTAVNCHEELVGR